MHVDSYSFGQIVIDGNNYTNDVIIFPNRVKDNWWRDRGHFLQVKDLKEVFEFHPQVLVVGKGSNGVMGIDKKVKEKLKEEGIDLKAVKTDRAVEVYNTLSQQEGNKVVAALHLTC